MAEKKRFLLRIDPRVYQAVEKWAADELRSVNAQIEFVLEGALVSARRLPPAGERKPASNPSGRHAQEADDDA